jgi:hypothetical protein
MQMDVWYNLMLQEGLETNPKVSELLEDAEAVVEPEASDEDAA